MNAEVIYVTENGVGDGMSWNSAAPLADALSWAAKGDEIYVAKGTYTGSFALKVAATVYGNCEGTETEPPTYTSAEGLETFLKGDGKRVVLLDGGATIYGFDISGGDASEETTGVARGGGLYINSGGGVAKYCRIHDNKAIDGTKRLLEGNRIPQRGVGGGAYVWNGRLENCIVENNIATTDPWLKEDNSVWSMGVGGGVCLESSGDAGDAVVVNCIIRNNCTTPDDDESSYYHQGGGIAIKSGYLINSLIVGNKVNGSNNNQNVGGGVCTTEKEAYIINCTAYDNHVKGLGGGFGFQSQNADGMRAVVSNCIAWGSPCIDAGDDLAIEGYDTDLDGNARIFGAAVDLGPYEVNDGSAIETAETNGGEIVRVQYYTMQGIEVTSPSVSGLYIVKKTYDTKKVVVEKNFISVK